MLLRRVLSPALEVNTYVIAPARSGPCLVVDPGAGGAANLRPVLADLDLTVAAVLATHGHPDHVWDAAEVADPGGVVVQVAAPDEPRLEDPDHARFVGPMLASQFRLISGTEWRRPGAVGRIGPDLLTGGGAEILPGLALRGVPAPGHTEGSTVFLVQAESLDTGEPGDPGYLELPATTAPHPLLLTGDVIFAGSVGRTDLPGGDPQVMEETLRTLAQAIDPRTVLLPGHGPVSTLARELATNPFLT